MQNLYKIEFIGIGIVIMAYNIIQSTDKFFNIFFILNSVDLSLYFLNFVSEGFEIVTKFVMSACAIAYQIAVLGKVKARQYSFNLLIRGVSLCEF